MECAPRPLFPPEVPILGKNLWWPRLSRLGRLFIDKMIKSGKFKDT